MRPLVLDASAGIKLVRAEPESAEVSRLLADRGGSDITVPELFWLELVNVLLWRHGFPTPALLDAIRGLRELGVRTLAADAATLLAVVDLMERHGLSAYDAAYLALALSLDADLLTADRGLAVAAGPRAVLVGSGRIGEDPAAYRPRAATWPSWTDAGAYLAELRAEVGGLAVPDGTIRTWQSSS